MTDNVTAYLEKMLKRDFESGNKSALLYALYGCLELKRPIPEWARAALLEACEAVERFEIKSWDDVFGRPLPKGMHLEKERRNARLRPLIIERVRKAETIDKALFEEIGESLGISGTLASNLYYDEQGRELRKIFDEIIDE